MSKVVQKDYDRVRNTYHYVINSRKGQGPAGQNVTHRFGMDLPPFPYPEHQGSQIGIFKLNSFHVCHCDEIDRVPMPQGGGLFKFGDTSGFYVIINGLGLRGQVFSNAKSNPVHGAGVGNAAVPAVLNQMNSFWIPNKYGKKKLVYSTDADAPAGGDFNVLSGGYSKKEVICSNPAGSRISVEVIDADTGVAISDDSDLYCVLDFSIEVIPTEVSSGN